MNFVQQTFKRLGLVSASLLILVQVLGASIVPLVLTETANASNNNENKPSICHPVNGNGQTGTGWNIIRPNRASSHINESLYPDGEYWKHTSKDGRHDVYAVNGECPADNTENGQITIKKDAISDSDQGFNFTTIGLNTDVSGFELTDDSTPGLPQKVFSGLSAGSYTITESTTSGWYLGGITCSQGASVQKDIPNRSVIITLEHDEIVTCTFENRQERVVDYCDPSQKPGGTSIDNWVPKDVDCLSIEVTPSCGQLTGVLDSKIKGAWGDDYKIVWSEGSADYTQFVPLPATFSEDYNGGLVDVYYWVVGPEAGYVQGHNIPNYWNQSATKVQIDTDCVDPEAKLTLKKKVTNNDGGKAKASDWKLKAQAGADNPVIDQNGPATSKTLVVPGVGYTLSEYGGPNGYAASDWDCDGGTLQGDVITLADKDDVVCTITNNDVPPTLTVTKEVINNNGGKLEVSDFPLYVSNNFLGIGAESTTSGAVLTLDKTGTYYVWEAQQSGYKLTNVAGDCEYLLGLIYVKADTVGGNYNCTLTNDDQPATITVKKIVKNNHGGTLDSHDFDGKLIANQTKLDHWETIEVNAGKHKLWEVPTPGYKLTDISCYSGLHKVSDFNGWFATVNLDLDQDVLCIYTNEDIAPKVTVKKVAYGANQTDEFQFKLNPAGHNNTEYFGLKNWQTESFDIKAGDITVEEKNLPDNWVLTDSYCKEKTWYGWKTVGQGTQFNAEIGEEYLCVFVNDKKGDISGYKFSDVNANGKWDEEEPALAGWEITIQKWGCRVEQPAFDEQEVSSYVYQNENSERYIELEKDCGFNGEPTTTPTNENGAYNFGQLDYGKYKVCEVPQAGWLQTKPNPDVFEGCYFVWVSRLGRSFDNKNFGNHQLTIEYAATPVCRNSFPYLQWTVTPSVPQAMFTPSQFTLDWLTEAGNAAGDPAGILVDTQVFALADVDYDPVTNTYSSETLWPGTDTILPDWPGWKLVGGEWVEDPSDFGGNLRPSASTVMQVNPTADTSVAYPPETEGCDPTTGQVLGASTTLANTGSSLMQSLIFGFTLIGVALGIAFATRKQTN